MSKKKFDVWEALEVRTGKQITLWILTIAIAVIFGNNLAQLVRNVTIQPTLFTVLYLGLFFVFRIILGYLFDEKTKRRRR